MDLFPLEPIPALPARVDRDAAIAAFARGVAGSLRRLQHGPLRSVALAHVPFRLHDVTVSRGRRIERMVIGIDAVAGALDLYRFDDAPPARVVQVPARNRLEPLLSTAAARDAVAAKVRRMVYQRSGFFAIGRWRVDAQPSGEVLYVPYWLGFFGRGETASLVVIDAVRRQIEGVKVRRLIEGWLHRR